MFLKTLLLQGLSVLILPLALLFSSLNSHAKKNQKIYDAIIVPGYPFKPNGKVNPLHRMRLSWALELYNSGRAKHIIVSGGAVHSPYVEAEIFALYLMKMGVPSEALILEHNAEHSMENIFYSMEIAEKYGFLEVAVATDRLHVDMIQLIGKMHGHDLTDLDFLPARFSAFIKFRKAFDIEIDHELAYQKDFVALKERESRETRKMGTNGLSWRPSETVQLSFASD
ncbi:MAG: vancomycin permeability regulator SanA, partial [Oceanospirillaceae bacterium]